MGCWHVTAFFTLWSKSDSGLSFHAAPLPHAFVGACPGQGTWSTQKGSAQDTAHHAGELLGLGSALLQLDISSLLCHGALLPDCIRPLRNQLGTWTLSFYTIQAHSCKLQGWVWEGGLFLAEWICYMLVSLMPALPSPKVPPDLQSQSRRVRQHWRDVLSDACICVTWRLPVTLQSRGTPHRQHASEAAAVVPKWGMQNQATSFGSYPWFFFFFSFLPVLVSLPVK